MMQSLLPLLVAVLTAGCQTAGTEQKADEENDYDLHVINPGQAGLREILERMDGVAPWVKARTADREQARGRPVPNRSG